jgi:hypothetical protein
MIYLGSTFTVSGSKAGGFHDPKAHPDYGRQNQSPEVR